MDLFLIRGLPNSGKTTVAQAIVGLENCFAADDYFEMLASKLNCTYAQAFADYRANIHLAHQHCQNNVRAAMSINLFPIAVHNTFTKHKELQPYVDLAKEFGYRVHIITVEKSHDGDNGHNVPPEVIEKMRTRWQSW